MSQPDTSRKPFIMRSEVIRTGAQDLERRETIIRELTDEDLAGVAGGTDKHVDYKPEFSQDSGGDSTERTDY